MAPTMHGNDTRMIRAAGGALWRSPASGTVEVALVHRPEYDDWSLPKGKLRPGEHPLVTACREVAEETGVHAVAGRRLDIGHYDTALGPKAVEYWAMQGPEAPFTPAAEVDRLAWLPMADARQGLDYQRDAYALDALEALGGAVIDATVLLVRNGRAVPTGQWAGSEHDRPLDASGREQADVLRRALPAFGPSRLLSACGTRFGDTMGPLGAELGLTVEDEPMLDEDEYAASPGRGQARILELAGAGGTTAICAPGPVIRHLLATLAEAAGLAIAEFPAKKGSAWALFFYGGQLAAADYYPALTGPRI
jgi:8-oxo-(d)GTP phosphatase